MKTVDAKGLKCPMPLILTKRALVEMEENELLEIVIDNETSYKNVSRFLAEHQMTVRPENRDGIYRLTVSKTGKISEETRAEDYCEVPEAAGDGYVVCVSKNIVGDGADELGYRLIQLFINTLPDIDRKPETIVFLNSSIYLVLKDSPVLEPLAQLEKQGVEILVCGTCLEFLQKKEELGIGLISNMYTILDKMSKAPKVLYP